MRRMHWTAAFAQELTLTDNRNPSRETRAMDMTGRATSARDDGDEPRSDAQAREHLWQLISDMRFGMLTTRSADGSLCARPLTTQNTGKHGGGRVLEFFVSARAQLVSEIASEERLAVVYADPGQDCYVSISGRGMLVQDLRRQQQLWSPIAQAWFPGGAADPDLRLLRVNIDAAEYWDVDTNKMVQLLKMAKAAIKGKPPTDMGEHREVSM